MGVAKPDPRIFTMALDEVGCAASKTIFVDDKRRNVDAATALGMKGVGLYRHLAAGAGYMTGTTVFVDGAIMMQSPGL